MKKYIFQSPIAQEPILILVCLFNNYKLLYIIYVYAKNVQYVETWSLDSSHGKIVEVCIDDQWHEATSAKITNNSQTPQHISIQVDSTSMIKQSVLCVWD